MASAIVLVEGMVTYRCFILLITKLVTTTYTYRLLNMRWTPLATCYPNPSPWVCVGKEAGEKSESAETEILGGHAPAPDPRQSVAMCLDSWMAGT
ncbi:hypothetical protein CEXT_246261 [Caerostris extrusa]|uniref:Secreted protein n=1 Tax=Caerostris extrusa TaxID=172846 RepID=A0AAV4R6C7_CAEEX|nr:hypothetical protein CEXT_246261 [Caerostris extrusa]